MRTIYKYTLPLLDWCTIPMPQGAKVLHIAAQHDIPQIWAEVDTDQPLVKRVFRVAGTGHNLGMVGPHVGSFMLQNGNLVFHVFEPD